MMTVEVIRYDPNASILGDLLMRHAEKDPCGRLSKLQMLSFARFLRSMAEQLPDAMRPGDLGETEPRAMQWADIQCYSVTEAAPKCAAKRQAEMG